MGLATADPLHSPVELPDTSALMMKTLVKPGQETLSSWDRLSKHSLNNAWGMEKGIAKCYRTMKVKGNLLPYLKWLFLC